MLINNELRQRVTRIKNGQRMSLIHMGYAEYMPVRIIAEIEELEKKSSPRELGIKREGKPKVRLTEEVKEKITEPAMKMILDGMSHCDIYEKLLTDGLLFNEDGQAAGYVTISRYITQAKRVLCIDTRPFYLKANDYVEKGLSNIEIGKIMGVDSKTVRRARSKMRCVQKKQKLTNGDDHG